MNTKAETRWLFQLNLLAVVGYYGAGIAKVAELLKGMYTYVGSDVHHDKHIGLSVKK
jgi:hypothetical protein